jgi:hypothetical protein
MLLQIYTHGWPLHERQLRDGACLEQRRRRAVRLTTAFVADRVCDVVSFPRCRTPDQTNTLTTLVQQGVAIYQHFQITDNAPQEQWALAHDAADFLRLKFLSAPRQLRLTSISPMLLRPPCSLAVGKSGKWGVLCFGTIEHQDGLAAVPYELRGPNGRSKGFLLASEVGAEEATLLRQCVLTLSRFVSGGDNIHPWGRIGSISKSKLARIKLLNGALVLEVSLLLLPPPHPVLNINSSPEFATVVVVPTDTPHTVDLCGCEFSGLLQGTFEARTSETKASVMLKLTMDATEHDPTDS